MRSKNLSPSLLTTLLRTTLVAIVASALSIVPVAASHADGVYPIGSGAAVGFSGSFSGSTVTFTIPAGAVTGAYTLSIANAGSTDMTMVSVSISGWRHGINHFNSGLPAKITMPRNLLPNTHLAYSRDTGASWTRIPLVKKISDITDHVTGTGYLDNGDGTVTILTYHLTIFGAHTFDDPHLGTPKQLSTITSSTPITASANAAIPVLITGSFSESITNIDIKNDTHIKTLAQGSWKQTATSISFTVPALDAGNYSIQLFNGSWPLLTAQTFVVTPVVNALAQTSKKKVTYIQCLKGSSLRIAYGVSPQCPSGYTKR